MVRNLKRVQNKVETYQVTKSRSKCEESVKKAQYEEELWKPTQSPKYSNSSHQKLDQNVKRCKIQIIYLVTKK